MLLKSPEPSKKPVYNLVWLHVTCAVHVAPSLMYVVQLPHDNLPKGGLWDKRSCTCLQAGLGLGGDCKIARWEENKANCFPEMEKDKRLRDLLHFLKPVGSQAPK